MAEAAPSPSPVQAEPTAEAVRTAVQTEVQPKQTISIPGVHPSDAVIEDRTRRQEVISPPEPKEEPTEEQETPEQRLEKVERQYKSLQGMHKGYEKKLAENAKAKELYLDQRKVAEQLVAALEERDRTIQELRAQMSSKPITPSQTAEVVSEPSKAAEPESLAQQVLASIDGDDYDAIEAQHGPHAARAWMLDQAAKKIEAYNKGQLEAIKKEFLEKLHPLEERTGAEAYYDAAEKLFKDVADYKYENGTIALPELQDQNSAWEIVQLWNRQRGKWDENYRLSPEGVVAAVGLWRAIQTHNQIVASLQPQPAPEEPPPPRADLDATIAPPTRVAAPMTVADRIRANYRSQADDAHMKKYGYYRI